jgi:hypothetical protein
MKISDIEIGFLPDEEKMRDFFEVSKEEFLFSYSYLTEEEYDTTKKAVDWAKEMEIEENGLTVVTWPESQYFMGLDEISLINDEIGLDLFGSSAYLVPDKAMCS